MDGIKKLTARLALHEPEEKPSKVPHTLSLNNHDYLTLHAYCKRKDLQIGEVVSELIHILLLDLIASGEVTSQDSMRAEELKAAGGIRTKRKT